MGKFCFLGNLNVWRAVFYVISGRVLSQASSPEVRDSTKHSTPKTAPTTKNYPTQNVKDAKIEKFWIQSE